MRARSLPLVLLAPLLAAGSAPAEEQAFHIMIDAPSAKVGAPAQAHFKLTPGPGRHVNKDFPTSLKLTAPAGVDLPKPTLLAKDGKVEEAQAAFDVAFTAKEAGKKTFTGKLSFAVCTAQTCEPHNEKVSFTVVVQ
jgi:hypothetical protein